MPPFAGDVVAPADHPPVDHDAAAAAGAEDDAEDSACSCAGTVGGFGQSKAVGIVGKARGSTKEGMEVAVKRLPVETGGVGVLHEAG